MITAQLATIPGRVYSMLKTVKSLHGQVHYINVQCNNYSEHDINVIEASIKDWQYYQKYKPDGLAFYKADNLHGDAEKFNGVDKLEGYIFTCDDDLIYPPDYVETMIKKIEQYGRKAVITCHGRTFPDRKITSYYRDKLEGFRCLGDVQKDVQVHSGGTGVMAWHSDLWRPEMSWFMAPNMADVFIGREAKKRGIPIICIEHSEGWIKYIEQPEGSTIWEKHINDDSLQTMYWNEY
jgi:hypothetical protein